MYKIGKLTLIIGTMYSGKSKALADQYEIKSTISKANTFYFKPLTDNRDPNGYIRTHDGHLQENVKSINPEYPKQMLDVIQNSINHKKIYVFIDEAQFFNLSLIPIIKELLRKGCDIFAGGLMSDYLGKPFKTISHIIPISDNVEIKKAVCMHEYPDGAICGEPAIFTQMFDSNKNPITQEYKGRIHIGAQEKFETRCREHFVDSEDNKNNSKIIIPKKEFSFAT